MILVFSFLALGLDFDAIRHQGARPVVAEGVVDPAAPLRWGDEAVVKEAYEGYEDWRFEEFEE